MIASRKTLLRRKCEVLRLSVSKRRHVRRHLQACEPCAQEVALIREALMESPAGSGVFTRHIPLGIPRVIGRHPLVAAMVLLALLLAGGIFRGLRSREHLSEPSLTLSYELTQKGVLLRWQAPLPSDAAYLVYRKTGEQPYTQLVAQPLTGGTSFLDTFPSNHSSYSYYVTALAEDRWTNSNVVRVSLEQVTAGVEDKGQSYTAAFEDYDDDGWLDLYVTNIRGPNRLYRNNQDGTFTDVTQQAGVGDTSESNGAIFGDVDNDGDVDLYVTNGHVANRLYENQGDGTFRDVTARAGVGNTASSFGAAWADFDNDGDLDLYVANFDGGRDADYAPAPNALYLNQGDGTFTNVAKMLEVEGTAHHLGIVCSDFDNDGDTDIYIAVGFGEANLLYENTLVPEGELGFREVAKAAGVQDKGRSGSGIASGDIDNDGDLDIYLTNDDTQPSRLYLNRGDGTFTDVARLVGVAYLKDGRGVSFADFDNDGYLDIVMRGILYLNRLGRDGRLNFEEVAIADGGNPSCGDYDNDGDVDIYFSRGGSASENLLYRNNGSTNHWLVVRLEGTPSNRSAVGAKVRLQAQGSFQMREVTGGGGYLTQDSLALEFGLGAAPVVEQLQIEWPGGARQTLRDLLPNQILTVIESDDRIIIVRKMDIREAPSSQVGTSFTPILFAGMSKS